MNVSGGEHPWLTRPIPGASVPTRKTAPCFRERGARRGAQSWLTMEIPCPSRTTRCRPSRPRPPRAAARIARRKSGGQRCASVVVGIWARGWRGPGAGGELPARGHTRRQRHAYRAHRPEDRRHRRLSVGAVLRQFQTELEDGAAIRLHLRPARRQGRPRDRSRQHPELHRQQGRSHPADADERRTRSRHQASQ